MASPTQFSPVDDDVFYSIIDRLKAQRALPRDSFIKEMPFFNFNSISKESQVAELFQDITDPNLYKSVIKNLITLPDEKNSDLIAKRLSAMQVMGFSQIILYKVLSCPEKNCPNRPREIATHNQYKDYEYECPFYHHEKDKRRLVITPCIEEEFVYKANYFEDGKRTSTDKEKHSQNYFESMFHPLYYKMFRCKREYCNFSQFCPFYHSEEEKKTWDRIFSNFIRKDRISYVKDKQKYYERTGQTNIEQASPKSASTSASTSTNSSTNNSPNSNTNMRTKPNRKFSGNKFFPQTSPMKKEEWRSNKPSSAKKDSPVRRDSGDSFDGNTSPVKFGQFPGRQEVLNTKAPEGLKIC